MLKICAISDTHCKHRKVKVEPCDILIHAGDWTFVGDKHQVEDFSEWLEKQPAKHIVCIPGNHERHFAKEYPESLKWFNSPKTHLLIDQMITIEGINIYGSPWTPRFGFDWAYNADRSLVEAAHYHKDFYIKDIWDKIPKETDILVTHGPAYGKLDVCEDFNTGRVISVGCKELEKKIANLPNLKYHIFGHIHVGWPNKSQQMVDNNVTYINASICDNNYKPVNTPVVFEYKGT